MTPGARIAAAIEILDTYLSGTAVEQALTGWGRSHRFAGSKDRAAIRDHVFDAVRRLRSSAALGGAENGRAIMIGMLRGQEIDPDTLFTGEGHAPEVLTAAERTHKADPSRADRLDCPDWMLPLFDESLGAKADAVLETLRHRAPVFLRVNTARATLSQAQDALAGEGIETQPHLLATTALEVTQNPRKINGSQAFSNGWVELQDAASQAVVEALDITPGMRVLDYCAGGGGKALAMAALGAKVTAHDIAPARMKDIPARAARAGCQIRLAQTHELPSLGMFDLVLADAPCSGSGSWRRAPQGKWLMTAERFSELLDMQKSILSELPAFVGASGEIAYATCSVLDQENTMQVADFMSKNTDWSEAAHVAFSTLDGGDGFYLSRLKRK